MNLTNMLHESALDIAACNGNLEIVQLLVTNGADVNRLGVRGSALHSVCRDDHLYSFEAPPPSRPTHNQHLEVLQLLLDQGVNVEARDRAGRTALDVTSLSGRVELANLLIECGARASSSALQNAAGRGHGPMVQFLLSRGADPKIGSPLLAASRRGVEVLKPLLAAGANPDVSDSDGDTPLHHATARANSEQSIRLLIRYGANVNAQNRFGTAPLHNCVKFGEMDSIRVLLEHGARRTIKDNNGRTPSDVAKQLTKMHEVCRCASIKQLLQMVDELRD